MLRILVLLLVGLAFTSGVAVAQTPVRVDLPVEGDYSVFLGPGTPESPPAAAKAPEKGQASLTPTGADKVAFVWDKKSGNVAFIEIAKIAGTWKPTLLEYKLVGQVRISVMAGSAPATAASIELKDAKRTVTQVVDPTSKGVAEFFGVAPGRIEAKVRYKSTAGSKTITQVFDLSLQRSEIVPQFSVALPDAATSGGGASGSEGASAGSTEKPAKDSGAIGGRVLVYVIGLGLAIALGFFGIQYMRKNPDAVSSTLEQLGAQIPKPGDADLVSPATIPDPTPRPQPVQKISLDDSAPDPIGVATPSSSVSSGVQMVSNSIAMNDGLAPVETGVPKLVSDSGDTLLLAEGLTVVGREPGQGLSLLGETTVSRTHARILRTGTEVTVTDAGSRNGTYINMQKIDAPTTLKHGDALQFGSVKFRYEG